MIIEAKGPEIKTAVFTTYEEAVKAAESLKNRKDSVVFELLPPLNALDAVTIEYALGAKLKQVHPDTFVVYVDIVDRKINIIVDRTKTG